MTKSLRTLIFFGFAAGCAQASVIYSGNGNGDLGFGGPVGGVASSLTFDFDGASTLSGTFTESGTGSFGGGGGNDLIVVYFDTVSGGFSDTSGFTDTLDGVRRAVSGFDGGNRSTLSFDGGFLADFALTLTNSDAALFDLNSGAAHTFLNNPGSDSSGPDYDFSFNIADIGLSYGDTALFVTTYIANSGFRSTESVGNDVSGTQGYNAFTSGTAQSMVVAVPEASESAVIALGLFGFLANRRRKRA